MRGQGQRRWEPTPDGLGELLPLGSDVVTLAVRRVDARYKASMTGHAVLYKRYREREEAKRAISRDLLKWLRDMMFQVPREPKWEWVEDPPGVFVLELGPLVQLAVMPAVSPQSGWNAFVNSEQRKSELPTADLAKEAAVNAALADIRITMGAVFEL